MRGWAAVVAGCGIAVGGCAQAVPFRDATPAEQAASLAGAFAADDRLMPYLLERYAVVVISAPGLSNAENGPAAGSGFKLRGTPGGNLTGGSAAVVDPRGYLATAAHVIGPDPILVLSVDARGVTVRPARVVYRGTGPFDFALLYAPGPPLDGVGWAAEQTLIPGTTLVGVGIGRPTNRPQVDVGLAPYAGRLVRTDAVVGPDGRYLRVTGSLPGHHGDSGGPQFAFGPAHFGLAGITTDARTLADGQWQTVAIRPDPAWVRRVIANDQRTLAALAPSTRP